MKTPLSNITRSACEPHAACHCYKYEPLRPLAEIEADICNLEAEIQGRLREVLS